MKDAVGGSLLLNLIVIFTSIVILFFSGILAYSKAYKVKNKIIEIIESNNGNIVATDGYLKDNVKTAIETELSSVGYLVSTSPSDDKCGSDSSRGLCHNLNTDNFNYCVCGPNNSSKSGQTYEVITYVHFAFPVIGDLLMFPVKGETKVLGKNYDY